MTDAASDLSPAPPPPLGPRIRALRRQAGLSLAELAARTEVSEATLSRIETGKSDISAPHLYRLAGALGVDIGQFFAPAPAAMAPGRRSVNRAGEAPALTGPRLSGRPLAADLRHKRMHPFLNHVTATTLEAAGGLQAHGGEEFLYVLDGQLSVLTDTYAPLRLEAGDSLYFDGSQPHSYLAGHPDGVRFLVINSEQMPALFEGDPR
ncbi:MAG: helix-turn-helix domain-containing protein [Pseudodonghicola sp.]